MLLREAKHECVELGSFVLVERGEELVIELAGERTEFGERALAGGGQPDDVSSPVGGVAASLDETAILELVEQPHELAAVIAESICDRPLCLARPLVQNGEHCMVVGMQAAAFVSLHRLVFGGEAEPLEQE